ncbi:UNVERIFIED_CONTAM: hypothetical protein Sindi_1844400, partial [Sesamum indicum]
EAKLDHSPQAKGIIGEVLQEKSERRQERAEGVGGGGNVPKAVRGWLTLEGWIFQKVLYFL